MDTTGAATCEASRASTGELTNEAFSKVAWPLLPAGAITVARPKFESNLFHWQARGEISHPVFAVRIMPQHFSGCIKMKHDEAILSGQPVCSGVRGGHGDGRCRYAVAIG